MDVFLLLLVESLKETLAPITLQLGIRILLKLNIKLELEPGDLALKIKSSLSYICHESIYQYTYKEAPELIEFLPRKHKKRRKKYPYRSSNNKIANKVSIIDRPTDINDRLVSGHWKNDSIVSPKHKLGCNVNVERLTRLVHIAKVASQSSKDTSKAIINKLSNYQMILSNQSHMIMALKIPSIFSSMNNFLANPISVKRIIPGKRDQLNKLIALFAVTSIKKPISLKFLTKILKKLKRL